MACKEEPAEEKPSFGSEDFGLGPPPALEAKKKRSGKSNWKSANDKRKAERLVSLKLQKGEPVKRIFGKQPLTRRVIQSAVRVEVQQNFVSRGTQTDSVK